MASRGIIWRLRSREHYFMTGNAAGIIFITKMRMGIHMIMGESIVEKFLSLNRMMSGYQPV